MTESFGEEFAHLIATITGVGLSDVIIVVNMLVANYTWEFDMIDASLIE